MSTGHCWPRDLLSLETIWLCWCPGQDAPKYASVEYYFELKLLKKWLIQERHTDLPICLHESRKLISHVNGALPVPGGRKTSLAPEIGNAASRRLYKPCYFFNSRRLAGTFLPPQQLTRQPGGWLNPASHHKTAAAERS